MNRYDENPAGRLHKVLSQIPSFPPEAAGRVAAREVWAQVLGLTDKSDTVAIYRGIGLLLEQVDKAEKLLQNMPDIDSELYLTSFPQLRKGIATPGLDAAWSNQLPYLTPVVLRDLRFCASKIAESYSEGVIEKEELAHLSDEVEQLFGLVSESPLVPDFKELLLDLLETMRRAIAEYRIRGVGGIREALSKGVGAVVIVAQQTVGQAERSTLKSVFELLVKVDKVVGRLTKYKPLLTTIGQKLLMSGEGGEG